MKLDSALVPAPAACACACACACGPKQLQPRTLLQCRSDPNIFIDLCLSSSDSHALVSATVTDLANLWLSGHLEHKDVEDLRLACPCPCPCPCPNHLSLQQCISHIAANLGLSSPTPVAVVQDPWHARVAVSPVSPVSELLDLTHSQVNASLPPTLHNHSLHLLDSSDNVQLSLPLEPIVNPDTAALLRPILASCASFMHSHLATRALQPHSSHPPLPSTPLLGPLSSSTTTTHAPAAATTTAPTPAPAPALPKKTSSSKKSTTTTAAAEKEHEKLRRQQEKLAKLAAKEADRLAKEAEKAAKDAERAAKQKEKEDVKRDKERLAEEKRKKKAVQGTARIMDMFVKRVAKPSTGAGAAAAAGAEGGEGHPAEEHVQVKYFDTLFVDFVPKRTMTVVPRTHFHPPTSTSSQRSARDILRSPARHASHLPTLPAHLRPTLVGQPLTDPESDTPRPRFKLLQFAQDLRPAYWGTWRKHSAHVTGRRPFARDTSGVLDYEYDSEAEWEEEEDGEGEEIRSDDDADDDESVAGDGEADMDDGWLLDDDEFARSAGTSVAAAGGRRVVRSLEPVVLGPFWGGAAAARGVDGFAVVWLGDHSAPLDPFAGLDLSVAPSKTNNAHAAAASGAYGGNGATPGGQASRKSNVAVFPEEHILTFIRAVHGNPHGVQKIVEELKARPEFASTPKTQLEAKLKAITVKEKRLTGKLTFYVKDDVLRHHRLSPTTLQVEPADPENDLDVEMTPAPPAASATDSMLPRLPFKPLALSAAVKRPAGSDLIGGDGKAAPEAVMGSPAKRAKVVGVGGGLPPLPVAEVCDENEGGSRVEDDEEEIGSDDSDIDEDEEDDKEYESDTDDGDADEEQQHDVIEIDGESDDQAAFPSPTPLVRRRPFTALPPPSSTAQHDTLPVAPPAVPDDDPMDVDETDPLLDFSVYDLSTLTSSTAAVSADTAPLILRQLLLNKDPLDRQSAALAALGTWAATTTTLPDSSDALAASPDFWSILPRCLETPELRANTLRMIQPACAQDPDARDATVGRVARDVGADVWRAVEAAVRERDHLGVDYGLAVVVDMAAIAVDEEETVEGVWVKVRKLVEWAAMAPVYGPDGEEGGEDLVVHGKRCALGAMYQYLCALMDFDNDEAVVARVLGPGGSKDEWRARVLALKALEWVKMEVGLVRTVDECVSMLSAL